MRTRAVTSLSWARAVVSTPSVMEPLNRAIRPRAPAASAAATTTTPTRVVRARTELRASVRRDRREPSAAIAGQPVAGSPDGLERLPAERDVDLAADVAHVDLDDVVVAFEVEVPHVSEYLRLGDHLPGPAHEELEQGEFPGAQPDLLLPPPAHVGGRVHGQVAGAQDAGAGPGPAPQ